MSNGYKELNGIPRLLMEIELKPVQGDRFQPTGFADLGAAVYKRPDEKRMILVESAQSIANRLEGTTLKHGGPHIISELEGLSYVIAKLDGKDSKGQLINTETSSLVEAHRLNSPFIISDKELQIQLKEKAGYYKGAPIDWRKVANALFFYDVNSLLHGIFMANLEDGRLKVPRALTGFIEAEDIEEVSSGGVKNNAIDPTGKLRAENYDKDVYSNVPYHRMEYTAGKIRAYFNLDLALIDGYGLDQSARELLISLALYKIRRFLRTGLRLRTACDLKQVGEIKLSGLTSFNLPDEAELLQTLKRTITECRNKKLFGEPPVTTVKAKIKEFADKEKQTKKNDNEESAEESED